MFDFVLRYWDSILIIVLFIVFFIGARKAWRN